MAQADLRRVERAARKYADSRLDFREAILQAKASGETYRDIAKAAGLSAGRIAQIVREAEGPRPD